MKQTTVRKLKIKSQQGFTLIELLVVIGILAILLAITLIAINPARQFAQARNTNRRSAVTQILNAVGSYFADHGGNLPTNLSTMAPTTLTEISSATFPTLCTELVTAYMPAIPRDPNVANGADITQAVCAGGAWDSGYMILKDLNNRVTATATTADETSSTNERN